MRLTVLLAFVVVFMCNCSAQNIDTVINKKHYNTILYYQKSMFMNGPHPKHSKQVLAYGSYQNHEKTGYWTYFSMHGNVIANGHYKNGKKIGKWIYNGPRGQTALKWYGSNRISEDIQYHDGITDLLDYVSNENGMVTTFTNGWRPKPRCIHWL